MTNLYYLMASLGEHSTQKPEIGMIGEHLTLVNGFYVPSVRKTEFMAALHKVAKWFTPLKLEPSRKEVYGEYHVWEVNDLTGQVHSLHNTLCDVIEQYQGTIVNPFHREKFSPHITGWVNPEPVIVDTFTLVNHQNGFGVDVKIEQTIQLY